MNSLLKKVKSLIKDNPLYSIISIGILLELSYLTFVLFQGIGKNIVLYMVIYSLAFVFFFIAYLILSKKQSDHAVQKYNKLEKLFGIKPALFFIIIFGLLFRITLIPSHPSTSDDVYRYIWEGKILYNGYNPFEVAPDDSRLNYLHDKDFPRLVSFPHTTTIYPSAAQAVFVLGYIISGESDTGLKIIYLFAELLTFVFLIKILRLRKQNENLVLLYSWLPLPIMESFINSHIDVIGITFFIIFIYFILKNKYLLAILPFALSVLTKLYPLIVFPLLIKKIGWKKTLNFGIILTALCLISLYPFSPSNRSINASLFTYLKSWSFNGSVYSFLYGILHNGYLAREISLALFIVSIVIIAIKYKDFLKGVYAVWISFIVFAATVYPWYLGWLAAINPFFGFYSVLSLFFTVNFSNITPLGDVWKEHTWVFLIEYIPFYFFLSLEFLFLKRNVRKP